RHYIILITSLILPGFLPAPDLPPGGSSFSLLEKIREEIIKKDKTQFLLKYNRFKKTLAKFESSNNWKEYNKFGYIGKYQFGRSALDATGYGNISLESFKINPASFSEQEQEKAMDILLKINETVMKKSINKFVGLVLLDSIRITRPGILAAAHLAGPANVKEFLESFGEKNVKDRMGTHVSDYLYHFSR
ncbi:MAG: transglycosylase family protein, partial [Bacteroidia bacterium]|nr:transglycosylase family protein [Bacteroidia bacterium]